MFDEKFKCEETKPQQAQNRKRENDGNAAKQGVQKSFAYGVQKEMTCRNILREASATRFVKLSFGKSLKQV